MAGPSRKPSDAITDGDFWLDDPASFEDPTAPTPDRASPTPVDSDDDFEFEAPAETPPAPEGSAVPTSKPSKTNRRQFDRHALDRPARVTEMDEFGNPGPCWLCRIVDLSRGGMGLRSKRMVHIGRGILVEIDGVPPAQTKLLYGIVRQSRYAEGEGYAVGVQFRTIPATASVRNWIMARGLRV